MFSNRSRSHTFLCRLFFMKKKSDKNKKKAYLFIFVGFFRWCKFEKLIELFCFDCIKKFIKILWKKKIQTENVYSDSDESKIRYAAVFVFVKYLWWRYFAFSILRTISNHEVFFFFIDWIRYVDGFMLDIMAG